VSNSLQSYLLVSAILLGLGIYGLLARRNLVAMLISLELILNSASLNFLAFNRFTMPDKTAGQVFAVFIIALAAAEVCIGLTLILLFFRMRDSVDSDAAKNLKG
jgi:NADH:ubiquinone oxidoreductase subunit K